MPIIDNKLAALRKKLLFQTKKNIAEQLSGKDGHVVRAFQLAKSQETIYNLLSELTFDWYGIHFPEFRKHFRDPSQGLQVMAGIGSRSHFSKESVSKIVSDESMADRLVESARASAGGEISTTSMVMVQRSAKLALNVKEESTFLQGFIVQQMRELAPNFSELATPMIAAQLVSKAGSLKRLSEMPSSTLQVLGAEEALFSHIKSGTKPPKHGFLFNHPYVKTLSKKARGKMARVLSGKLAICLRSDVFGGKRIVDEYKPKLEKLSKNLSKMKETKSFSSR